MALAVGRAPPCPFLLLVLSCTRDSPFRARHTVGEPEARSPNLAPHGLRVALLYHAGRGAGQRRGGRTQPLPEHMVLLVSVCSSRIVVDARGSALRSSDPTRLPPRRAACPAGARVLFGAARSAAPLPVLCSISPGPCQSFQSAAAAAALGGRGRACATRRHMWGAQA